LGKQHKSASIIRAMLALGRSLEIPVLAEGIETKAHLDFMRNEGCEEAQGYFLGRPMPVGLMFPQIGAGHKFRSEPAALPGAAAAAAAG
ncbi:MAG: EAL domain-containing protein, partial [Alphaproteobacteria bacterium]